MDAVASPATCYVNWEEVFVSNDKGRREVHYFLKRKDGNSDLAVVGKEKSLRHMSYHYAIRSRSLASSMVKLKSRREVIDWLNLVVSDSAHGLSHSDSIYRNGNDAMGLDIKNFKDVQITKLGHYTKELIWLGSPWTCRKRRKHYQSFRRNGVRISVHDFIYVLVEEGKRLVAYLDDMYEDSRGNKMVVVRWFHKIDEVGTVSPLNFNGREIYFSLCLQDLSIECIDGLATVLSPQHFEKFLNEARHTLLDPFVCRMQFENDEAKPFDITQVKGYWKQEILRFMHINSPSKSNSSPQTSNSLKVDGNDKDADILRPAKRHRGSRNDGNIQCTNNKESIDATCQGVQNLSASLVDCKIGTEVCSLQEGSPGSLSGNEAIKQNSSLAVGSHVEVLSQDSGMRGCWLRALIIKKYKDRVKVQYQDIQDAEDETNKLEEWIVASRVAVPDQSGIRVRGRSIVRPPSQTNRGKVSWVVDVGSVVDVWWHDGWWEGIVIRKESENRFHIFFPGEKQESIFGLSELRHSQEWVGNTWRHIKDRPDLVTSILSALETDRVSIKSSENKPAQAVLCESQLPSSTLGDGSHAMEEDEGGSSHSHVDSAIDTVRNSVVPDLSKDSILSLLKWKSTKKRTRVNPGSCEKLQKFGNNRKFSVRNNNTDTTEVVGSKPFEGFFVTPSMKVDHDNCKYMGDALFTSSVVPPLTNLVMSR